ncbi:oligosaccharide flippase family protein [Verrucomicrobia bacterium]|nr:oligosaccharide flippase family protein [Verrucomicrobiota bacterium]
MSFASRSLFSLFANLYKGFFVFITGILLARGLGPEEYGVLAFLLASFVAIRSLLEMGTSSAFPTFISKRSRSRKYFFYYIIWMIFQLAVSLLFIAILTPDEWLEKIWGGESRVRVLVAFVAVFMQQQVWNMVAQIGESQRFTVRVQSINVAVVTVHLAAVAGMLWLDALSIERICYFITAEIMVACVVAYFLFPMTYTDEVETPQHVFKEYWKFCLPLIPRTWMIMIMGYADTRLLQHYGGGSRTSLLCCCRTIFHD